MDEHAMLTFAGNALVFWAAAVGVASVIVHSRVAWRSTPVGRHLMIYMGAMACVLTLACIRVILGDSWWFQLIRLVTFVAVPIAMTQRLAIQLRAQRDVRDDPAHRYIGTDDDTTDA